MKTWIIVLVIGIIISFVGLMIPLDGTFGVTGFYVLGLGVLMVVGGILAAVLRLWGKMLSD